MIVRLWRGVARAEGHDAYLAYFKETGLRDYRAAPGNSGVQVLLRPHSQGVEWLIVTWWESIEAVRSFVGDDPELARYYPDDALYFDELPERVEHFDVALIDD